MINASVATDVRAPLGEYTVEVTFKVSSQCFISNVKAKSVPSKCKPCGNEAVRVILNTPDWQPAIMQNERLNILPSN